MYGYENNRLLFTQAVAILKDTRGNKVHFFSWTLVQPRIFLLILLQYGTKISRILRETRRFSKKLKSSEILDVTRLFGYYRTRRYTVENEFFWTPKRNAPGSNPGKRAKKCRKYWLFGTFSFIWSQKTASKFFTLIITKQERTYSISHLNSC